MKLLSSNWLIFLLAVFMITACSNPAETNDPSDDPPQESDPKTETTNGDVKIENDEPEDELGETKGLNLSDEDFDEYDRNYEKSFYVFAQSGLNMRETSDPGSKALQVVPFGSKVTVLAHPEARAMLVDGYSGGMAKIEFQDQVGYMFDGYLCRFPTPKKEMQPKAYVEHIKKAGPIAIYHHERLEDDGYIQNTEGLIVPTSSFDEAFLLAKILYGIPEKIYLPPSSKEAQTIVANPDKKEYLWSDEIQVNRKKSGEIKSIYYYLRGEGGGYTVIIERDDRGMKIAETAIAD